MSTELSNTVVKPGGHQSSTGSSSPPVTSISAPSLQTKLDKWDCTLMPEAAAHVPVAVTEQPRIDTKGSMPLSESTKRTPTEEYSKRAGKRRAVIVSTPSGSWTGRGQDEAWVAGWAMQAASGSKPDEDYEDDKENESEEDDESGSEQDYESESEVPPTRAPPAMRARPQPPHAPPLLPSPRTMPSPLPMLPSPMPPNKRKHGAQSERAATPKAKSIKHTAAASNSKPGCSKAAVGLDCSCVCSAFRAMQVHGECTECAPDP